METALAILTMLSLLAGTVLTVKTTLSASSSSVRMLAPPPEAHPGGVQAP
jgi:hypothetical protein